MEQFLDKEACSRTLGIVFDGDARQLATRYLSPGPEFMKVIGDGGQPNPEGTIACAGMSPTSTSTTASDFIARRIEEHSQHDFRAGVGPARQRAVAPLDLNIGEHVRVRGFLRSGEYLPALEDAVVIRERPGFLPEPDHVIEEC